MQSMVLRLLGITGRGIAIAAVALALLGGGALGGTAGASPHPSGGASRPNGHGRSVPPPCYAAFPQARSKSIGRTTWYNRQASVRMVACYHFGLMPSADFPVSASMVCGLVAAGIDTVPGGHAADKLSLFASGVDGACSGAELAADPAEPAKYVGIACSWASDLLGDFAKPAGVLGSIGCATAPAAGHALGTLLDRKSVV